MEREIAETARAARYAVSFIFIAIFIITVLHGKPLGLFGLFRTQSTNSKAAVVAATLLGALITKGGVGWVLMPFEVADWFVAGLPKTDLVSMLLMVVGIPLLFGALAISRRMMILILGGNLPQEPKTPPSSAPSSEKRSGAKGQASPLSTTKTAPRTASQHAFQPVARTIHGDTIKRDPTAFERLIGVDEAIYAFKKALQLPLERPDLIERYGITPIKGILLYGPPGTGKTSLARAASRYFGVPFVYKKTSEFQQSLVGSTEANVREIFQRARGLAKDYNSRCILFFDEIDAIGRMRDGKHMNRPSDLALSTLLEEMDGFNPGSSVLVIAATNRRDVLDPALLRPGRFDKEIEVGLPNHHARYELFQLFLKNAPIADEENFSTPKVFQQFLWECAGFTEGASPAEIQDICQEAKTEAAAREARGDEGGITMKDLRDGLKKWARRKEPSE